ncbi:MAG: NAD(P)-binding domain-containing protein [Woeseiaceae bacterium]|nr:NAD(P)-binding domain-containing protein [Woeseiaceae bacterium]
MRRAGKWSAALLPGIIVTGLLQGSPAVADTIAIIGTDEVASALGPEFAAQGHTVVYGSRSPDRDQVRELVARTGPNASATLQSRAATDADIVVLAVPWDVVEAVVANLGDLAGKIVIDPTNPRTVLEDGLRWYPREESNAELIQRLAPRAHVVKAFNTMSAETMIEPETSGGPVSVPLVGNDPVAKQKVAGLIAGMGLEPIDLGPVRYARIVEGMYYLRSNARMAGRPFNYHLRSQP